MNEESTQDIINEESALEKARKIFPHRLSLKNFNLKNYKKALQRVAKKLREKDKEYEK